MESWSELAFDALVAEARPDQLPGVGRRRARTGEDRVVPL